MAGILVKTVTPIASGVWKISLAWTSTAGGAVSANPFDLPIGTITQVKFVPAGGGNAPTDNYTATLKDTDGVDYFAGYGAATNLKGSSSQILAPYFGMSATLAYSLPFLDASQQFDLVIAAAGAAKQGTVLIWQRVGTE